MSIVKRWTARIRSRLRSAGRRVRLSALALAALVVVGGLWLAMELGGPETAWRGVLPPGVSPADRDAAVKVAEEAGMPHRMDAGRLVVPADSVERLRGLLAYKGVLAGEEALPPRPPDGAESIFLTESQREKMWLAWKMGELSRLIDHYPAVERATVLYEPGLHRRLGRPAVPPVAAVHIQLAEGERTDARLVSAIADLLTGSFGGLARQDVRIVDDLGGSYRASADGAAGGGHIERLRAAESYYIEKIQSALRYVEGTIVGVGVEADGEQIVCRGAKVSVPRSYLAAIHRASGGGGDDPNGSQFEAVAAPQLERIGETLRTVLALKDTDAVKVDWYYDQLPAGEQAATSAARQEDAGGSVLATRASAAVLTGLGVLCGVAAVRRRRRRGGSAAAEGAAGADAFDDGMDEGLLPGKAAERPIDRIRRAGPESLESILQSEGPQTVALILAHVEPTVAAAVLAGFGADLQIDLTRRIAELAVVDPRVVDEVARGLVERWTGLAGGAGAAARILHHAGYATEKAVLDELTGNEPALAESIRSRMFVFEDVALLPKSVLRTALESLGSDELAIALRTAGKAVREKVLSSVPKPDAASVRQEMERIGPVRLSDVEAAQQRVVSSVRRLEAGRYISARTKKDSEVLA